MTVLTRMGQALAIAAPSAQVAWQKLTKHGPRAFDYARLSLWLLTDCLKLFQWGVIKVAILGIGRFAFRAAALATLFFFVKSAETNEALPVDWIPFPDPGTNAFLILGVTLGMSMLMASSYMMYEVVRQATEFGRRYNEFCARRFFVLASRLPDDRAGYASELIMTGEGPRVVQASRTLGLVSRNVIRTLPSFIGLIGGGTILLVIDPMLTLTVALLALLAIVLQYPANHGAAKASRRLETYSPPAVRRYRDLIRQLRDRTDDLSMDDSILDRLFQEPEVQGMIEGHSDQFRSRERASFVSKIGGDAILGISFILIGLRMLEGDLTWAEIGVFVVTLRFALKDFVACAKMPPMVQMFHVRIDRYSNFVLSATKALGPRSPIVQAGTIRIRSRDGATHEPLDLKPGSIFVLAGPSKATTPATELLWQAIDPKNTPLAMIASSFLDDAVTVNEMLGLRGSQQDRASVLAFLDEAKVKFTFPSDFDASSLDSPVYKWAGPKGVLTALQLHVAKRRGSQVIAIDATLLDELDEGATAIIHQEMADRIVVLLTNDLTTAKSLGAEAVICHDGNVINGWSSLSDIDAAKEYLACRTKNAQPSLLDSADDVNAAASLCDEETG